MRSRIAPHALAGLLLSLVTLMACAGPGAQDGAGPTESPEPTPTVAVETPESTVTPAATSTSEPATPTATPEEEADPLTGSHWLLVSLGAAGEEATVLVDSEVTLQFVEAGHAGGSAGCNSYGGEYQIEDGAISFGPLVSTMMACADEALMEQEGRYLMALQSAGAFELSADKQQLTIWYDDGAGALNYTATAMEAGEEPGESDAIQLNDLVIFAGGAGWATARAGDIMSDQILTTNDGGQTWQLVTPQEATEVVSEPPFDRTAAAHFASPTQAWVAFSRALPAGEAEPPLVWLTDDGGQTWRASEALDLEGIPFDYFGPSDAGAGDGGHGWLLAHLGAGMSHDYIAIFTTADGGQSWQRVADPDNNPEIQPCSKSGLLFTSEQEGWLSGNCPGLMPPLFLYGTADGGASWQPAELPELPELGGDQTGDRCGIPQLAQLPSGALALALRCFNFEDEQSQAWLFTTSDGGASWQSQTLPEPAGVFRFLTDDQGWYLAADENQLDENSRIYYTADGGATWQALAQIEGLGQPSLFFANEREGWAIAGYPPQRTLLHTSDGGATWQVMEPVIRAP